MNDPAHYRRMAEPFASADEANASLEAFFAEVRIARDRHCITDVVVLVEVSIKHGDDEVRAAARATCGDQARVLSMLAREFGAEEARHEATIAELRTRGRKAGRK